MQGYIFWPFPPWGGGEFLSKLKNREEFDGVLHEKRMGNRGGVFPDGPEYIPLKNGELLTEKKMVY